MPTLLGIAIVLTGYRMWVIHHLGIDLYVDEAYYWGWSQALDWGYYSKPPVIAALIAASTALFGDGLLAVKLPSLLLYPTASLVLCALATRMFDPRIGFWCGLSLLTMPLVGFLGLFASTDAPLMLCWITGMLALWRALQEGGRWADWMLLGAAVGIGLLTKYTMAAFLPSALLVMLLAPEGRRALLGIRPWLALALAALIFSPNLWWNIEHDFPTFQHTAEITQFDGSNDSEGNAGEFIAAQVGAMGPLLFVAMLWAMVATPAKLGSPANRLLYGFSIPLLALVSAQAVRGGANANWAAPALAAGVVLAVAYLGLRGKRRWLIAAVAINVLLTSVVYHWPDILRVAGVEMTRGKDLYKRARGWQALANAVAPQLRAYPEAILVAPDRELLAHLIYFLRPDEYASWNPDGRVVDHYQISTSLHDALGRDLLYVSRKPELGEMSRRFGSVKALGEQTAAVHRDYERRVYLFLLSDFRGYAPR